MKRLIVCCDGTWQRPDQNWFGTHSPTNVVRLGGHIAKAGAGCPQVVWYDQGVGTGNLADMIGGGITGSGLDQNIIEAYRFLVANYVPGDDLFLFGFSRGAYTVRSLAGMIRKCGIIRRDKLRNYAKAMELYRDAQHPDDPGPKSFRADFSVTGTEAIPIKLIGVWDTVGALGIPFVLPQLTRKRYQFHNTELSKTVEHAYQALAVDERRKPFAPTLWTPIAKPGQKLEQVWFSGTHSDIGGGIMSHGLPDLSLAWMLDKARAAGLVFDPEVISADPPKPDPLAPMNGLERALFWLPLTTDRPIGWDSGAADRSQSLHPAVLQRWDADASYRPRNLMRYFESVENPRASKAPRGILGFFSRSKQPAGIQDGAVSGF
jgi:uncharacterized protein (DUF2235 family)